MKINNILKGEVVFLTLLCILCLSLYVKSEATDLKVRVLVDNANIRLRAASTSPVVGNVPIGTILESEGIFGEWYRVKLPPNEEGFVVIGYIHQELVESLGETKEVKEIPKIQKEKPRKSPPQKISYSAQEKNARTGFFLRGALGYGPMVNMNSNEIDFEISGGGAGAVISLGSFINERLLVYGEISGYTISDPEMTFHGYTSTASGTSAHVSCIGAGMGYYLAPNSIFAGLSIYLATLTMENPDFNLEATTDTGFGFGFQIGKDFIVSRKVLLGVAGHASISTMKDKEGGPRWNTTALGIMMTISWAPKGWR